MKEFMCSHPRILTTPHGTFVSNKIHSKQEDDLNHSKRRVSPRTSPNRECLSRDSNFSYWSLNLSGDVPKVFEPQDLRCCAHRYSLSTHRSPLPSTLSRHQHCHRASLKPSFVIHNGSKIKLRRVLGLFWLVLQEDLYWWLCWRELRYNINYYVNDNN